MTQSNIKFIVTLLFAGLIFGSATASAGEPLLCTKGKLILDESFSGDNLDERWAAAKGDWKIVDGALQGTELEADHHAASIRTNLDLPGTLVMQFDFKFDGGKVIHCSFNGRGHICRATITPNGFNLKGEKVKKDPEDKSVTVDQVQQKFATGTWYTMRIEMAGEEIVAQVDDGPVAFGSHEKIAREKNNFGFPMAGVSSQVDNIKIWSAAKNPNWAATKTKLPVNKIVAKAPPTLEQRFSLLDKDQNGGLSLKEYIGNRSKDKHEAAKKQFAKRDIDRSGSIELKEFVPAKPKK